MRLVFVLLITLLVSLAAYATDQRVVEIATNDSVQIDNDTTWYADMREIDTSKPVQLVVYISTYSAGNIGIYLYGCPIDPSTAAWVSGAESLILCHSRTGITSTGKYTLQLSHTMESNASADLGFMLPYLRAAVATDNAAVTIFSAWLVYHVK